MIKFDELSKHKYYYAIRAITVIVMLYVGLITSWISDDAQITFRSILNFISGSGITFNYGERVQVFTHPLWFFILSGFVAVTRELFTTVTLVSVIFSTLAILILVFTEINLSRNKSIYITPVLFLAFSLAFCDFMTSGLENPLTYFLISVLFFLLFTKNIQENLQIIFFILALLVLTRYDFILLFLPLTFVLFITYVNKGNFAKVFWLGVFIIVSWLIFSTIYFGTPLPNTFYAKLTSGLPQTEFFVRGFGYYVSLVIDFNTIIILCLGLLSILLHRNRFTIAIYIGKILYLFYILYVGGDHMLGRFFSPVVFLSICELIVAINLTQVSSKFINQMLMSVFGVIFVIGIIFNAPLFTPNDHNDRRVIGMVMDERGWIYLDNGLFSSARTMWPHFKYENEEFPEDYQVLCGFLGITSLTDVAKIHIDSCALTDPYLSRIPAIRNDGWRIAHHARKIPTEYGLYKIGKIDQIPDKSLRRLFNDVSLVVKGELFTSQRFKAIWNLMTDSYIEIDEQKYSDPEVWVPLTNQIERVEITNFEDRIRNHNFNGRLEYVSMIPKEVSTIWLNLDWAYSYEIFINDRKIHTLLKHRHCPNGNKIFFAKENLVRKIRIDATDVTHLAYHGYNDLISLRFLETVEDDTQIESGCQVKL